MAGYFQTALIYCIDLSGFKLENALIISQESIFNIKGAFSEKPRGLRKTIGFFLKGKKAKYIKGSFCVGTCSTTIISFSRERTIRIFIHLVIVCLAKYLNQGYASYQFIACAPNPLFFASFCGTGAGPCKHVSFASWCNLRFVSRGHWRDTVRGRGFSSVFLCFPSCSCDTVGSGRLPEGDLGVRNPSKLLPGNFAGTLVPRPLEHHSETLHCPMGHRHAFSSEVCTIF